MIDLYILPNGIDDPLWPANGRIDPPSSTALGSAVGRREKLEPMPLTRHISRNVSFRPQGACRCRGHEGR